MNYCEACGKKFESCSLCKDTGTFKWRLHYCSINCFKKSMSGDGNMRVQYNGKTYAVVSHDHVENKYEIADGVVIDREQMEAMILTKQEIEVVFPKEESEELI